MGKLSNSEFDINHVLPNCVGNEQQQVLPVGIVCKKCNNYFGTKIEPALLRDSVFHVIAVFLRLRHPDDMNEFRDKVFDAEHPCVGKVERSLNLNMETYKNRMTLDVDYRIRGQLSQSYQHKELALLSRAIHKIAFESLAHNVFVTVIEQDIDVFDSSFDAIRKWARYGNPHNSIRPVLRLQRSNKVEAQWKFRHWLRGELNLFGDWYVVSLTSQLENALQDLRNWVQDTEFGCAVWSIGEQLMLEKKSKV